MAISFQCTFDATDPHRLAGFWASALGYEIEDADGQQGPLHWVTMADPEGNEFCIA